MWHALRKGSLLASIGAVALAGCSEADEGNPTYDMAETVEAAGGSALSDTAAPEEAASGELAALSEAPAIPVSLPKMAYVFDYGFRMDGEKIADLQQKHADLCEAQGPYTCQILSMSHSGEGGELVTGKLELAVAADKARGFGAKLTEAAQGAGGEQIAATIGGEDLSKRIVDTEARLRSRIVLRDRLLDVLRTRNGKVSELVEAERSVARVNEEIDQARSWLEEMRGRVAFSRVNVAYESASPAAGAFVDPIRGAVGAIGGILGTIIAVLIVLAAVGIPLLGAALGIRKLRRRYVPETVEA